MFSQNLTFNSSVALETQWGHCGRMIAGLVVWTSLGVLLSLLGCPACVAVFRELHRRHKAGTYITPNDFFMINLTIMDLIFLFFIPLGMFNFLLWQFTPLQKFTNFLYTLSLAGRPLLTACICLDGYLAVVHPITYSTHKSLTPRVLMAAFVWTATVIQGYMSTVNPELTHDPWAICLTAIAVPIIFICDASIYWTLKKSCLGESDLNPRKKKALHIITNTLVMTFTSYVPPVLMFNFGPFIINNDKEYECFIAVPTLISPVLGSAIMPLLYLDNLGTLNNLCC